MEMMAIEENRDLMGPLEEKDKKVKGETREKLDFLASPVIQVFKVSLEELAIKATKEMPDALELDHKVLLVSLVLKEKKGYLDCLEKLDSQENPVTIIYRLFKITDLN